MDMGVSLPQCSLVLQPDVKLESPSPFLVLFTQASSMNKIPPAEVQYIHDQAD